jgi:hypothetical protein
MCYGANSDYMRRSKNLLDDLVGAGEQSRGNVEADRLRRFAIDGQLEFGGLLHREIAGFFTLEDTIDVRGGPAVLVEDNPVRRTSSRLRR